MRERLTLTAELDAISNELGSLELRLLAAFLRAGALLESGDVVATEQLVATMERLAGDLRQPVFAWMAGLGRAMLAILRGAPDAEQRAFAAFQIAVAAEQPDAAQVLGAQLAAIRRNQGRYGELADAIRASVTDYPHYSAWRAALALLYCETDHLTEAREQFDILGANGFDIFVNHVWALGMHNLAEACAYLGDAAAAALLYPRLEPVAEQVTVSVGALCNGSLGYPAGLLAACLGRWEEAERHFAHALAMNERLGARPFYVRTQRGYAGMLVDRRGAGDAERAAELITVGLAEAERLGMAREVIRFQRLRERMESAATR